MYIAEINDSQMSIGEFYYESKFKKITRENLALIRAAIRNKIEEETGLVCNMVCITNWKKIKIGGTKEWI